jgi:hypothetical protein
MINKIKMYVEYYYNLYNNMSVNDKNIFINNSKKY